MSEPTISGQSFYPFSAFGKPGADDDKTPKESPDTSGMKFMTHSEMAGGKKPEAETGSASGGVQASAGVGDVSFSAGNSASISF